MRSDDDDEDKRCDLPVELRRDLKRAGRDFFDAVCITHTDSDHCKGFGEFFWLEHAAKHQAAHRVKINELWVPAAAVLEEGLKGDARLVRAEARHRLREGKGILVFSRPDALKKWFEDQGLDFEKRKHLIVDAGQLVPGYSKTGPEKGRVGVVVAEPPPRRAKRAYINALGSSLGRFAQGTCASHDAVLDPPVERVPEQADPGGLSLVRAIHCCFVDVFVELRISSNVSHQWVYPSDASLPSCGSRRTRFPDLIGTIKALRLPAPHVLRLIDSPAGSVVACRDFVSVKALPERGQASRRAWSRVFRVSCRNLLEPES